MSNKATAAGPLNIFIQASLTADSDRIETAEWLESLDGVRNSGGLDRCKELLRRLFDHARSLGVEVSTLLNTPYCNTIARSEEPPLPWSFAPIARALNWVDTFPVMHPRRNCLR
jgi:pyruvate dehydrogenase complex dehydrogenase (E1) component